MIKLEVFGNLNYTFPLGVKYNYICGVVDLDGLDAFTPSVGVQHQRDAWKGQARGTVNCHVMTEFSISTWI